MNPVNISFHLIFFSSIILAAMAAPINSNRTNNAYIKHIFNDVRNKRDAFLCPAGVGSSAKLNLKLLEKRGYCHYNVHENKYGNREGKTRNPDVIYSIMCEETINCKQVYLPMEVTLYINGSSTCNMTKEIPAGCIYSATDLQHSTNVDGVVTHHIE